MFRRSIESHGNEIFNNDKNPNTNRKNSSCRHVKIKIRGVLFSIQKLKIEKSFGMVFDAIRIGDDERRRGWIIKNSAIIEYLRI